jgi:hypothetical protein
MQLAMQQQQLASSAAPTHDAVPTSQLRVLLNSLPDSLAKKVTRVC